MHLRRRAEDDGIDLLQRKAVGELGRDVPDAVFGRDLLCRLQPAADQRHHLDPVDVLDAVEMPDAERARTGERDLDRSWPCQLFSRIRWPTAVLLAGTW